MKYHGYFFILIGLGVLSCKQETVKEKEVSAEKLTSYVNTFTGTDGPGNTYPGAVAPFGMVQLSPDNGLPGWDRIAGYFYPDSTIAGFSHTHLSGTGAGDMYDLLVMPLNSRFNESLTPEGAYRPYSKFSHDREEAGPGYYAVDLLSSGIKAELTTTSRVGFHQYTFPKDDKSQIILDLGYSLNWDKPMDTKITIEDNQTISGYRKSKGWANDQRVYFVMQFSKPFDSGQLFKDSKEIQGQSVSGQFTKIVANYKTGDGEKIKVKVALSSASIDGARKNLEAELPHWDFEKTVKEIDGVWEKFLSKITIEGTEAQKELFYTNLYHVFLTPSLHSDIDGAYKGADGKNHIAEGYNKYDTFSLWDTFRATHPLYTLLAPKETEDMIKSFLSHYDETGLLPVWSLAGNETNMMIGYHAVPVIVDAYFKGIPMDAEKALEACVASANEDGRQIDLYKRLGYVPTGEHHENWSVSKTLEYAYNDWCIAQLAKDLGKDEIAVTFTERADNWKNLYDPESSFFRPKDEKGKFISPFSPKEYTKEFCESNAWQYFWFVPHDIDGLEQAVGKEEFAVKLDSMFTYYPEANDKLPIFSTGMIGQYAHGNEPSHHVAFLYNNIGKPWKTQEMVRKIIETQYSTKPDGYCGNEDCGQMSAWLVLSSMGIYPINPAKGVYSITSPFVEAATINLEGGKQFVISTENQSKENCYIQSITLNGKPYDKLTITHEDIVQGGELHFVLGNKPNKEL
ncbi:GH92 family glycosyl hydrolase [Maribacter polysaccharolyticus]|uniref:GH92 family glycosyl hydrolase n=1 Tax=Maribacter polysaccharolyticus TaxID=3020831 RepID=UPI00237FBC0E|nr:GH92 family glycosyl hydrolase [Maribacter polysaccharolyticus]MDE3742079.1 GH92 family glycosyl hydrolase [Maribacter polysaccharolyticus]